MSATGPRQEEEGGGGGGGGKGEKGGGGGGGGGCWVNQNDSGSQCRLCLSGW